MESGDPVQILSELFLWALFTAQPALEERPLWKRWEILAVETTDNSVERDFHIKPQLRDHVTVGPAYSYSNPATFSTFYYYSI